MSSQTRAPQCPELGELEEFVTGRLGSANSAELEGHLEDCAACRDRVDELRSNLLLLDSMQVVWDPAWGPLGQSTPTTIGPYRILSKIGEGGMGAVFEAEQENPRRKVALKIIRPARVSAIMLRRFQHEMQVLGRLHHPGIAQIFEGGTHVSAGADMPVPYFVMELVDGSPLIDYVRRKSLPTAQRLELMSRICDAVAHAHEKGILHRDLKPGNILVCETDGQAQPKILDFGVARAIEPDAQLTNLQTDVGQLVGTTAYMSPEQITADSRQLDARSDVYALGVILYELLAERLPHDAESKALPELIWSIANEDPTPLRSINAAFRGDIDAIVSHALEKERSRRYASAAEMAADIRRCLQHQPIVARPPSTLYQLRKFARRNRALVGGVALAFAALLIGTVASTVFALRAQQRRAEADEARANAEAVVSFLTDDMIGSADPAITRGRELTVVEALDKAAGAINEKFKDRPRTQSAVRLSVAVAYQRLGRAEAGLTHARLALDDCRRLRGDDDPVTLAALHNVGLLLKDQGKLSEAEPFLRQALAGCRRALGDEHRGTLAAMNSLVEVLQHQRKLSEAEALCREAMEKGRRLLGSDHRITLVSIDGLGVLLMDQRRYEEAEPFVREATERRRRVLGADHPDTLGSINNLAGLLHTRGKDAEAEPLFREAAETTRRVRGPDHPTTLLMIDNLASLLQINRKLAEAETLFGDTLSKSRSALGDQHLLTLQVMLHLGVLLEEQGRLAEAEPLYAELYKLAPAARVSAPQAARCMARWGPCLNKLGRHVEAEQPLREAHRRLKGLDRAEPAQLIQVMTALADMCEKTDRASEAAEWRAQLAALASPATTQSKGN